MAALALVLGIVLLQAGGDRPVPGTSRIEATQAFVAPLPPDDEQTPAAEPALPSPVATEDARVAPTTSIATTTAAVTAQPAAGPGDPAPSAAPAPDRPPTTTSVVPTDTSTPPTSTSTSTTSIPTTTTPTSTVPPPVQPVQPVQPIPVGPARARGSEAEVVPLTNADRNAEGLGSLTRNGCLDSAASRFAEQMARSGVLAHNPGAGPAVTGCRPGATWGDNVGTSEPCDAALLERKWMASAGHRRNILTGAFQLIGVGAWTDEQGGCWVQVLFSS